MLYALDAAHHCDIETIDTFLRTLGRPLEERHFETLAWRCATHPDIFGVLLNEDYGMVSDPGMAESMQKLESTSGDYERNTVITKYLTEHFKAVSEDIGDCTLCGD